MKQILLNSIRLRAMMLVAVMCTAFAGQTWGQGPDLGSMIWSTPIVNENFNDETAAMATEKKNPGVTNYTAMGEFNCVYNNNTSNQYGIEDNTTLSSKALKLQAGSTSPIIAAISGKTFASKGAFSFKITTASKCYIGLYNETISGNAYAKAKATAFLQQNAGALSICDGSSWVSIGTFTSTDVLEICVIYNSTNTADSYGDDVALASKTAHIYVNGSCVMNGGNPKAFAIPGCGALGFRVSPTTTSGNVAIIDDLKIYDKLPTASTYTVTSAVNDAEMGSAEVDGVTITASPNDGYRVKSGSAGYTVSSGTATVTNNGDNTFTVTPTTDCTITINFEAIPTHNAVFSVNGITSTQSFAEGATITFPSNPSTTFGKVFKGWSASAIVGTTNVEPEYVTSATMGDADVTYYAIFATETPGTVLITDELTRATTGVTGTSYLDWNNKTASSDAKYAGQSAGGNSSIQLRAQQSSGIVSTTSGGKLTKIVLEWNSNTTSGRTVNVYGKNSAYASSTDLYNDNNKGTSLGTIVYGTSTSIDITGDYTYIGLASSSGALYLTKVSITWAVEITTYSDYCTTIEYSRTVTPGNYGTICLPYATTAAPEGATFYTVGGTTENGVMLVEHDGALAAGTPYVFKATDTKITAAYTGDAAVVQDATGLVGNLSATPLTVPTGCYVLSSNLLRKVNGGTATVAQNRAYFDLEGVDEYPVSTGVKAVVLGWNEATGIDLPATEKAEKVIFDLSGRRVEKPAKGLYIVNGKKVLF